MAFLPIIPSMKGEATEVKHFGGRDCIFLNDDIRNVRDDKA